MLSNFIGWQEWRGYQFCPNSLILHGSSVPRDPLGTLSNPSKPAKVSRSCLMTDRDRYGNIRRYFRRYGRKIRLHAEPGTQAFDEQVAAARQLIGTRKREPKAYSGPFVYFILFGSNARVKIGTARDPRKRIKELSTGAPGKVRLYYCTPGGRELERALHTLFAEHRINGEWFVYASAIREWIAADEARRLSAASVPFPPLPRGREG